MSSTAGAPFYVPSSDAQRFQILNLFVSTCCFLIFYKSHTNIYEVESIVVFI